MDEYISKQDAVDAGYLSDWYISSVSDEPPVWTEEHIDELLNDFLVIPKDTPVADVQPVKHGWWLDNPIQSQLYSYICSNCRDSCDWTYRYCPCCGAKMDLKGI